MQGSPGSAGILACLVKVGAIKAGKDACAPRESGKSLAFTQGMCGRLFRQLRRTNLSHQAERVPVSEDLSSATLRSPLFQSSAKNRRTTALLSSDNAAAGIVLLLLKRWGSVRGVTGERLECRPSILLSGALTNCHRLAESTLHVRFVNDWMQLLFASRVHLC